MYQNSKAFWKRISDYFARKQSLRIQDSSQSSIHQALFSDSQNTRFELCVYNINRSEDLFRSFRSIYDFRSIVETVSYKQGLAYLKRISELEPDLKLDFDSYRRNDSIGSPLTYAYPKFGKISPTTIRYVSVALEIRKLFGNELNGNFVEIGAGYGGQASIFTEFFDVHNYSIYDLPVVQELTGKYLSLLGKNNGVEMLSITESDSRNWDFALSNYAFSELPAALQKEYLVKVLQKSKRGYMIMNSGQTNNTGRSTGKLSIEEIREYIPNLQILPEVPLTGPDNYLLVWGPSGL
jgi:hypothetical protein